MTTTSPDTGWVRLLRVGSTFVNPATLGPSLPTQVAALPDDTVEVFGDTYRHGATFAPGTVLALRRNAGGYLYVRPLAAVEDEAAVRRTQAAADARRGAAAATQKARESREFNTSLNIPARWTPDANPYAATDWHGQGRVSHRSRLVYHVRLIDSLHEGRLHRDPGQTLCAGANSTKWGDLLSVDRQDRDAALGVRVTCRGCLAIAQRWVTTKPVPS